MCFFSLLCRNFVKSKPFWTILINYCHHIGNRNKCNGPKCQVFADIACVTSNPVGFFLNLMWATFKHRWYNQGFKVTIAIIDPIRTSKLNNFIRITNRMQPFEGKTSENFSRFLVSNALRSHSSKLAQLKQIVLNVIEFNRRTMPFWTVRTLSPMHVNTKMLGSDIKN